MDLGSNSEKRLQLQQQRRPRRGGNGARSEPHEREGRSSFPSVEVLVAVRVILPGRRENVNVAE